MCGITGWYAFKESAYPLGPRVDAAMSQMDRRGPDNAGIYCEGMMALGHKRLSIIDTATGASQPMQDTSGRYRLVFNGEILNYKSLSDKYLGKVWEKEGGPRTSSDTEVLLQLLIHYGLECLNWLHGFFALAFYDAQEGSCLLVRDRFGKKPLLYHSNEERLVFASEIKALLEYDDVPRQLNPDALYQYLQLSYVPPNECMMAGIERLQAGSYLLLRPEGAGAQKIWYRLDTRPKNYGKLSYEQAQEQLVALMDESVQERMVADVPLGAFLSGGIDSSIIVALASRHTDKLRTFSVGYKDNSFFDETQYARLVADRYQTEHTVFSLSNDDFLEHLHDVLDYLDEPFADPSALPVYILSKETRKHVTVALSGDGGDEVFAGYNKHMAEWRARNRSWKARAVTASFPVLEMLPKGRNNKLTNTIRQLHRFAEGTRLDARERYLRWASIQSKSGIRALLRPGLQQKISQECIALKQAAYLDNLKTEDFNEVLLTDMQLVLPGDMLVKADLMSMANSLEIRSPFLANRVVEFAFGLPAEYKINGGMKKRIVQDAFRSMLPAELYNRPKQGFDVPMLGWFRKELDTFIFEDLLGKAFVAEQGIFNYEATRALRQKLHSSDPGDSVEQIWALVVFQNWCRKYLYASV